jgi:predicted dehydrogenase
MARVGVGLIGCGTWGKVHARTHAAHDSVNLVATCDVDARRAEEFARNFRAQRYYSDWRGLLEDPEIQAVSIATPDFAHGEVVLAALQAGKDVLVEKPLATTVEECESIVAARERAGVKLMVDFHNRWNLPFVNLRSMLDAGDLGKLLMMNIRLNDTLYVPTEMLGWARRSSPAHFLGAHLVDLVRWLSGAEVNRVYSVSRSEVLKRAGIDTPDFFQSVLELSDGGTAVIENCWILNSNAQSVFDFQCEFIATRGTAYVNASHHRMMEVYTDKGAALPDVSGAPELYGKPVGFCVAAIEHFIDCVATGKQPAVKAEDGLAAARIIKAIEDSAKTRMPVDLD